MRCAGCEKQVQADAEICPLCGGPVDIARVAELELKLKPDLRKARTFLGIVTALETFWLLPPIVMHHTAGVVGRLFVVVFFGGCFAAAFRRPLGASIAALAMLIMSDALAIGTGRYALLFQGLIVKIVLVILLVSAIRAGYRVRDLRGKWSKRDLNLGIGVLAGSAILGLALGIASRTF